MIFSSEYQLTEGTSSDVERKESFSALSCADLRAAKWIVTAVLVVSAIILVLGIADAIVPGLNWNYSWQSVAFAFVLFVISGVIRHIIVKAINSKATES